MSGSFIVRLDLRQVAAHDDRETLPQSGLLSFLHGDFLHGDLATGMGFRSRGSQRMDGRLYRRRRRGQVTGDTRRGASSGPEDLTAGRWNRTWRILQYGESGWVGAPVRQRFRVVVAGFR